MREAISRTNKTTQPNSGSGNSAVSNIGHGLGRVKKANELFSLRVPGDRPKECNPTGLASRAPAGRQARVRASATFSPAIKPAPPATGRQDLLESPPGPQRRARLQRLQTL